MLLASPAVLQCATLHISFCIPSHSKLPWRKARDALHRRPLLNLVSLVLFNRRRMILAVLVYLGTPLSLTQAGEIFCARSSLRRILSGAGAQRFLFQKLQADRVPIKPPLALYLYPVQISALVAALLVNISLTPSFF